MRKFTMFAIMVVMLSALAACNRIAAAPQSQTNPVNERLSLEQSGIHPDAFDAAKEFLLQFPSIFSLAYGRDSGEAFNYMFDDISGELMWFDRFGNEIDTPSFLLDSWYLSMPHSFFLYDLDDGGMPVIFVGEGPTEASGGRINMYRFIDGEYRQATILRNNTRFYLHDARWIMRSFGLEGTEGGYYFVAFDGDDMVTEPIVQFAWPYFTNAVTGEIIEDFAGYQTLFGMFDIALQPAPRLIELEARLRESIRNELLNPPCRRSVLLEQIGISEYSFRVAVDFLRDFTSIFTGMIQAETFVDGVWKDTGRFILGVDTETWEAITTYVVPEIYYALSETGVRGVYDRQGNEIYEAPWLRVFREGQWSSYFYASHFSLFDFDNDGIPEIFIFFRPIFDGIDTAPIGFYSIFRYVDGEYRELEWRFHEGPASWAIAPRHRLFLDDTGRIITFFEDAAHGSFFGYEHLVMTDYYAILHPIVVRNEGEREAWAKYHREEWGETPDGQAVLDSWVYHSPTIFGTDIPLTLILPFAELGDEIRAYLSAGSPAAAQPAEADRQTETYTIEQIQAALQMQFTVGDWGEGNPQVISAQRVERDTDYIIIEAAGPYPVDLTNSSQYRVEVRYRQSLDDFNFWYRENGPFRRDGDYTILTTYYFFNDANGEPVLAFILC